jgi:hypothetical protein
MPNNIVLLNPTTAIKVTAEMSAETAALVGKFIAINAGNPYGDHGALTIDRLVAMLLEDVAAAVKDGNSWQGAHMALVLGEHRYWCGG